ncbi:hypothetical protein [Sciscionella marina]|uniref:hypothetical protein n=1 Tax=Sciscionella marina TaxID=508770 RepID=UPI00037377C8|nr:hypothetical protein [Sciscionella marina]
MTVTVLAPLRIEALSMRSAGAHVLRTGMGRARSLRAAPATTEPAVVAGFGGALDGAVSAGDLVVGNCVRAEDGAEFALTEPERLAALLRESGLTVHLGPVVTTAAIVHGARRSQLAATGALIADMESAHLLHRVTGPRAVIRAVVDTPRFPLSHPRTVTAGIAAIRTLRRVGPGMRKWAEETTTLNTPAVDLEV